MELDQLWAEAVTYWRLGEPLYLSGDVADAAKAQQESHREVSVREGLILDFLEKDIPRDWASWSLDRRRVFWSGSVAGGVELVPRQRVCALEIWCELFDGLGKDMRRADAQEINSVIATAPGWQKAAGSVRCGYCGVQKGFVRV